MKKIIIKLYCMKKLLLVSMLIVLWCTVFGQGTEFLEGKKWSDVLKTAQEQGKYIFMDCYTSWCGPCKGLAQNVFPQPKVGAFLNSNFVCCKYDMEKGEGIMLYKKYKDNIPGFPTMLVINPADESIVHKVV